jgi:hypothetical protein
MVLFLYGTAALTVMVILIVPLLVEENFDQMVSEVAARHPEVRSYDRDDLRALVFVAFAVMGLLWPLTCLFAAHFLLFGGDQ